MSQSEGLMNIKRILVPVNGSRSDEEAIELACSLARRNKAKIYVTYVIQVKRALPLDAEIDSEIEKAEGVLALAERIADDQDCEVFADLLQAREVGPAVVDEAGERHVDLVIIGLGYKKRFGQFDLGSTVPYVLKNAPCPVIILREPIPVEEHAAIGE